MKIQALINNTGATGAVQNEHGLSLYLEIGERKILFDTGASKQVVHNADALGISLSDVDTIIISHGHYDHVGGLSAVLTRNHTARVYVSSHIVGDFSMRVLGIPFAVGQVAKEFVENEQRMIAVGNSLHIDKQLRLFSTAMIPDNKLVQFYHRTGGSWMKDTFHHEIHLLYDDGKTVYVVTGCCHVGIEALMHAVKQQISLENKKVCVIGGLHLIMFPKFDMGFVDKKAVSYIRQSLRSGEITQIITCHCTGKKAYEVLHREFVEQVMYLGTGNILFL